MKKQIVIHFGPPKTGTSAVQSWLMNNQPVLRKNNVFYPEHRLDSNSVSSGNVHAIYSDSDNGLFFDRKKAKRLLTYFNSGDKSVLLLSSEHFFFHLPELVDFFSDATFIGYIRSPLEYFESAYNQSIKRHRCYQPMELTHRVNGNYLRRITQALEIAGEDRFHLRAYNIDSFKNNDIVSDFLSYFQLEKTGILSGEVVNSSYCFEALEFMRWLNQFELSKFADDLDNVLQKYSQGIRHFSLIPSEDYQRYRRQSINLILNFCRHHSVMYCKELISNLRKHEQSVFLKQRISTDQASDIIGFILANKGQPFLDLLSQDLYKQYNGALFEKELLLLFPLEQSATGFLTLIRRIIKANMSFSKKILLLCNYFKR